MSMDFNVEVSYEGRVTAVVPASTVKGTTDQHPDAKPKRKIAIKQEKLDTETPPQKKTSEVRP